MNTNRQPRHMGTGIYVHQQFRPTSRQSTHTDHSPHPRRLRNCLLPLFSMTKDWGTQEEWIRVSLHFFVDTEDERELKIETVKAIARNESRQSRLMAKEMMQENGIWEQALQIAKENDLEIQ